MANCSTVRNLTAQNLSRGELASKIIFDVATYTRKISSVTIPGARKSFQTGGPSKFINECTLESVPIAAATAKKTSVRWGTVLTMNGGTRL